MNNFIIINLQALTGMVALILGVKWWLQPRLSKLPIHLALLPFVYLNAFRYLGLTFMTSNQFYGGFPDGFLYTVGIWDFATAVFALITAATLKANWKYAIPLVWVFNVFGFTDLITAFPQFFSLKLYDYDLGIVWLVFVTFGLAAFLSHIYIFIKLIQNLRTNKA